MSLLRACLPRLALVTLGAAALVLVPAAAAEAHVHVESDSNVVGTDATLTFRVPTESDTASTVKVVVTLPSDPPLLSVSPQVVAGWTATVAEAPLPKPVVQDGTTLTRAPHTVTWTAAKGGGIPPEQFAELALLVENLPAAPSLTFPTAQYYSDGTVVQWNQPSPAGGPEPEHPVPTLELVASSSASPSSSGASTVTVTPSAAPAADTDAATSDTLARWLSVLAIVVSVAAVVVVLARRRRPVP